MTYATPDDVATELGREISADGMEYRQVGKWLNRCEMQIRQRIPVLDDWCADETYKAIVVEVESAAVARKALNPEGLRSTMTQIDDGSLQTTYDSARPVGEVVVLESEWDMLLHRVGGDLGTAIVAPEPLWFDVPRYPCDY